MQGVHRLLDRRIDVKAMTLQQVNVVEPKALQRVIDTLEYMLARDSDFLSLQATKEPYTVIPSRAVLTTRLLLGLPLEYEASVAEGC